MIYHLSGHLLDVKQLLRRNCLCHAQEALLADDEDGIEDQEMINEAFKPEEEVHSIDLSETINEIGEDYYQHPYDCYQDRRILCK